MAVIDAWASPLLTRPRRAAIPEVQRLFDQSRSPYYTDGHPTREVGPRELVDLMDDAGIDTIMLSAWCRPEGWISTNDDVAEFTTAHPDRIVGVATVDLRHPPNAVAELRRAVQDLGFKALRVVPWLWSLPPNDRLYFPLYVTCIELGVPFCTQVGHTGPLKPSEVGRPVPYLDDVLLTFPELVVVGGHIGHPWTDETIGLAWKHANFYIDTSAYRPRYYPPQLIHFLETYGRSKVLFGTNWPQLSFKQCVEDAAELPLSESAKAAFMGSNAAAVFGLAPASEPSA